LVSQQFEQRTRELIDSLKAICAAYGLGNDGNEFKIITQVFLYKFLNDKFAFEAKKIQPALAKAESWEAAIAAMSADDMEMLQMQMGPDTARLKPEHFIAHLFESPERARIRQAVRRHPARHRHQQQRHLRRQNRWRHQDHPV
jgi:type I restriction enzyme M protein